MSVKIKNETDEYDYDKYDDGEGGQYNWYCSIVSWFNSHLSVAKATTKTEAIEIVKELLLKAMRAVSLDKNGAEYDSYYIYSHKHGGLYSNRYTLTANKNNIKRRTK